ncbi:hypothetical protein N836_23050 [Leptolyngbya sp. Heron Island J]|uniref:hypothetical protein n=1 Tax=Leptolyngbya sp. Heron Island J TaxID=1385935 RepID=UPI0003B9B006|nr:hypothetical protein [Leptolyngbya sp. Heron Island J]ESA32944.1 hypothetical protein N836_23050 [Leptolyngbya sp. Heron Island J]
MATEIMTEFLRLVTEFFPYLESAFPNVENQDPVAYFVLMFEPDHSTAELNAVPRYWQYASTLSNTSIDIAQ